jgi:hypothetical protein
MTCQQQEMLTSTPLILSRAFQARLRMRRMEQIRTFSRWHHSPASHRTVHSVDWPGRARTSDSQGSSASASAFNT